MINGENAAGGFGITEAIYNELLDAGADAVTLGNHAWDQREALVFIERAPRLIRPLNYPPGTPGRGAALIEAKNGARVLVINAMGRIFMDPLDDPFAAIERELAACPLEAAAPTPSSSTCTAEATSEKQAMGYFADGRASLVVGTHTHVPTADHRILPRRHRLHVRRRHDRRLRIRSSAWTRTSRSAASCAAFRRRSSSRRTGPATLCGVAVETDDATGLALTRRRRCGSAARWKRRGRRSGTDRLRRSRRACYNAGAHSSRASGRHGRPFPIQEHHAPQGAPG